MWYANFNLKRLLFTAASLICFCSALSGQGGFNLRTPIEGNTVFQSVHCVADSTFIVAAWSRDTLTNDHLDFEILNYNCFGEMELRHSYSTPDCIVNISEESESSATNFIVQPEQSIKNGKYAHQVFWYNNSLDTLFSVFIQSPFLDSTWVDSDFMNYQFSIVSKDSSLFYSIGVWKPETTGNDVCIKKLSPTGEELWTYIYASDAEVDACYALLPQVDGGVIAGIIQGGQPEPFQYLQTHFKKINNQGDEQWSFSTQGMFEGIFRAAALIGDGSLLASCGAFHNTINAGDAISAIIKFDTFGTLLWKTEFGEYTDYNPGNLALTNIVQSCDSNYVAGGSWFSIPGSEEIIEGQNNPDYDQFANIVKLDRETGDVIWERKYRFLEIYRDQHKLVDMKATLDGGVIFCGEARDTYSIAAPPMQQGWLVKLDECGCLVPGCDTLCSYVGCGVADSSFFPSIGSHFIVGPNPASQFINIYVGTLESLKLESLNFQLFDIQGKLVYEFLPTQTETTYMLSTDKFAGGLYVLSLSDGERVLQQEKIVVER